MLSFQETLTDMGKFLGPSGPWPEWAPYILLLAHTLIKSLCKINSTRILEFSYENKRWMINHILQFTYQK